ncbi:MAG: 4Fe-4S dicluster domain-containing protein [Planctomycetota bacterium]|nr:4Fe-4S dicluster domain-containing protein [Planctomycetota bacterium]
MSSTTRRDLLGGLSAAALGLGLPSLAQEGEEQAEGLAPEPNDSAAPSAKGANWGMVIDLDLCTGCSACVVSCRSENNIPLNGRADEARGCEIDWMSLLPLKNGGSSAADSAGAEGEHADPSEFIPIPCMHCDNPACIKVCPVNATYLNDEGLVAQIWDRCIGCRYCMTACPYSRRSFNWKHPEWAEEHRNLINPDVATRPDGVVEKCTFCYHRIRTAKEKARLDGREVQDSELQQLPACASVCPPRAITFGDLNDPESEVAHLAASPRARRLLEHLGTKPKVVYLSRDRREAPRSKAR